MSNLFLHIGFPKTGSSAVQSVLHRHFDALVTDNIFFPPFYGGELLRRAGHEGHNSMVFEKLSC